MSPVFRCSYLQVHHPRIELCSLSEPTLVAIPPMLFLGILIHPDHMRPPQISCQDHVTETPHFALKHHGRAEDANAPIIAPKNLLIGSSRCREHSTRLAAWVCGGSRFRDANILIENVDRLAFLERTKFAACHPTIGLFKRLDWPS